MPTKQYRLPKADIEPNFAKFDSETPAEREAAYLDFRVHELLREKRARVLRPVNRFAVGLFCAAALFALSFLLSSIPLSIDRFYTACRFSLHDGGKQENTSVIVKGKLYSPWFSDRKSKGKIVIDNMAYTKRDTEVLLVFPRGSESRGWLTYSFTKQIGDETVPEIKSAATVWTENRFDKIVFQLYIPTGEESGIYSVCCARLRRRGRTEFQC